MAANWVISKKVTKVHLRKVADEGALAAGRVPCVQAVVEGGGVAGVHAVHADVEPWTDAAPQVNAAAGELKQVQSASSKTIVLHNHRW